MAAAQLHTFFRVLRRTVAARAPGGLTDAELLERFVARRDEAAFELLVWRHGPMVWHTCRRALGRDQDAEDAFQATFLALVHQARSLRKREALAGWLHRVAQRVALRLRAEASKRARFEKQVEYLPDALVASANGRDDLRQVLDEEIDRLPEKYRVPVILCYLEGKTNDEAARQLGCPRGTILSRLARARERLKVRLLRRGVTPAGAGLGAAWASAASAGVSAALVEGTVKAATGVAAGQAAAAVVSAHVAALTEGVLHAMFLTKVKFVAGVLLAAAVVGSGLGWATHPSWAQTPGAAAQADKPAAPVGVPAPQEKLRLEQKELEQQLRQLQQDINVLKDQLTSRMVQLKFLQDQMKIREEESRRLQAAASDPRRAPAWRQVRTLEGHTDRVYCVVFSPDGKLLASGGGDEVIRLWDLKTGGVVRQFVGHKGGVTHLAFSPDGRLLASVGGTADNAIYLWDVATGAQIRRLQAKGKLSFRLAFSPDGRLLATAGADTGIQLWDVPQGREAAWIAFSGNHVTSLAFAPDGKTLISAGQDRTIRLWDAATGREVRRLQDYDELLAAAFSPDGKVVAAGSKNGTVVLWDAATGKQLTWQQGHRDLVSALAFTPDGKALLSASKDRTILYYPLPAGEAVPVGRHESPIIYLAVSPDGRTVASGGEDRVIRLWRLDPSAPVAPGKEAAPAGERLGRLLKELLDAHRGDDQILEALYLAALTRLPAEKERTAAREALAKVRDRQVAFRNLLQTLIDSPEFGASLDMRNKR